MPITSSEIMSNFRPLFEGQGPLVSHLRNINAIHANPAQQALIRDWLISMITSDMGHALGDFMNQRNQDKTTSPKDLVQKLFTALTKKDALRLAYLKRQGLDDSILHQLQQFQAAFIAAIDLSTYYESGYHRDFDSQNKDFLRAAQQALIAKAKSNLPAAQPEVKEGAAAFTHVTPAREQRPIDSKRRQQSDPRAGAMVSDTGTATPQQTTEMKRHPAQFDSLEGEITKMTLPARKPEVVMKLMYNIQHNLSTNLNFGPPTIDKNSNTWSFSAHSKNTPQQISTVTCQADKKLTISSLNPKNEAMIDMYIQSIMAMAAGRVNPISALSIKIDHLGNDLAVALARGAERHGLKTNVTLKSMRLENHAITQDSYYTLGRAVTKDPREEQHTEQRQTPMRRP